MSLSTFIELTDDEVDVIRYAISQTYLFDGWTLLVEQGGKEEADLVASVVVALGYEHPRMMEEEP